MGLLSFFRKSDRSNKKSVKGQPYEATAPAKPPLRGKYPVAGNGPNSLQTLHAGYVKRAGGSIVSLVSDDEASAPPPIHIHRFHGTETPDRPTTAPHSGTGSRPVSRTRQNRNSTLATSISLRKLRTESLIPRAKSPSFDDGPISLTTLHRRTLAFPPPQPEYHTYNGERSASVQSNNTARARHFVDLLDAQSEFRPTNFHTRVRASGIRNYGEDVADRNVGENGVDISSVEAQQFYCASPGPGGFVSAPSPIVARTIFRDPEIEGGAPGVRTPNKLRRRHSRGSSQPRSFSMKSHTSELPPIHAHERWDSPPTSPVRANMVETYVPSGAVRGPDGGAAAPTRHSRSESMYLARESHSLRDEEFLHSLARHLRPSASWDRNYQASQGQDDQPGIGMTAKSSSGPRGARARAHSDYRSHMRRSTSKSRMKEIGVYPFPSQDERYLPLRAESARPFQHHRSQSGMPSVHSKRQSLASIRTAFSVNTLGLSLRDSRMSPRLHGPMERQIRHRSSRAEYQIEDNSGADDEGPVTSDGGQDTFDDATDDGTCPPPSVRTGARRYVRKASLGGSSVATASGGRAPQPAPTADKMDEMIYDRMPQPGNTGGCARQWSLSSVTTPPSLASLRPQSGHTANTSLDSATVPHHQQLQQQQAAMVGGSSLSAVMTAANSRPGSVCASHASLHMPHSPLTTLSSNFNIDDYVSSDEESETAAVGTGVPVVRDGSQPPRKPRGEGEEELLFREVGYGSMQLPGLFDGLGHNSGPGDTGTATPVAATAGSDTVEAVPTGLGLGLSIPGDTSPDHRSMQPSVHDDDDGDRDHDADSYDVDNRPGTGNENPNRSSNSSPLLSSLMVPTVHLEDQSSVYSGSRAGSINLRHSTSAPAVRRHSAFGASYYSLSNYGEDDVDSRPSTSAGPARNGIGVNINTLHSRQSLHPSYGGSLRHNNHLGARPSLSYDHVSEESGEDNDSMNGHDDSGHGVTGPAGLNADDNSGGESASDFEEEDRHLREEFARTISAQTQPHPHARHQDQSQPESRGLDSRASSLSLSSSRRLAHRRQLQAGGNRGRRHPVSYYPVDTAAASATDVARSAANNGIYTAYQPIQPRHSYHPHPNHLQRHHTHHHDSCDSRDGRDSRNGGTQSQQSNHSNHSGQGPILRLPLPIKPSKPVETHHPTLPSHQAADTTVLPVHQIQLPVARRAKRSNTAGMMSLPPHPLDVLRYSPAHMPSSSEDETEDDASIRNNSSRTGSRGRQVRSIRSHGGSHRTLHSCYNNPGNGLTATIAAIHPGPLGDNALAEDGSEESDSAAPPSISRSRPQSRSRPPSSHNSNNHPSLPPHPSFPVNHSHPPAPHHANSHNAFPPPSHHDEHPLPNPVPLSLAQEAAAAKEGKAAKGSKGGKGKGKKDYAYGHGGPAFGNGYGFIRVLRDAVPTPSSPRARRSVVPAEGINRGSMYGEIHGAPGS